MSKNFKKRAISLICVVSLLISCTSMAFAVTANSSDTGMLMGKSTIATMTYIVTVPTTLDFQIDQYKLASAGIPTANATTVAEMNEDASTTTIGQIASAAYPIYNFSAQPVVVGFTLKASPASDVTLVAEGATLGIDNKEIQLSVLAGLPTVAAKGTAATAIAFDSSEADSVVAFDDATETAQFAFLLEQQDSTSTTGTELMTDETSAAAIRFYGFCNTKEGYAFKDGDCDIVAAYKLQGLGASPFALASTDITSQGTYVDGEGALFAVASAGQLIDPAAVSAFISLPSLSTYFTGSIAMTKGLATSTAKGTITSADEVTSVASVVVTSGTTTLATARTLTTTDFTSAISTDKKTVTLTLQGAVATLTTAAFNTNAAAIPAGTYTITVTLNHGTGGTATTSTASTTLVLS